MLTGSQVKHDGNNARVKGSGEDTPNLGDQDKYWREKDILSLKCSVLRLKLL